MQHMQVKWSERAIGSGNQVGLRETFTVELTVLRRPLRETFTAELTVLRRPLRETFTVELTVLRRPLRGNAERGHDRLLPNPFIHFRLIFAYAQGLYKFVAGTAL